MITQANGEQQMGQLYMQKFENWGVMDKSDFDTSWEVGFKAF